MARKLIALALAASAAGAAAAPGRGDRVYTADQNSNTVSVIDASADELLGQIKLGNPRPEVLGALYKGQLNVHGLGASPDGRTLAVVSVGSNAVTFVDPATNQVKGTAYIGRAPHEPTFTPDGKEVWVTVRGEDFVSVLDPKRHRELARIPTAGGPGMITFRPDGKIAFVVSSFNPVVDVVDVKQRKVLKKLQVVSPFSPFVKITPDGKQAWMTHKDVGKVTRIDAVKLEVKDVIDTGFITNHVAFARTDQGTLAYVSVGGENAVKVFTTGDKPEQIAAVEVGALPHGIWGSDDGSRVYVGLENADAVDVIDTASNRVVKRVAVGQAPQALLFVANAVPQGEGRENLVPRVNAEAITIPLRPSGGGKGTGTVVVRPMGLVDALEVSLFRLDPAATYAVYVAGHEQPVGVFRTNDKGMVNATVIAPVRKLVRGGGAGAPGGAASGAAVTTSAGGGAAGAAAAAGEASGTILVMQGEATAPDPAKAVLASQ